MRLTPFDRVLMAPADEGGGGTEAPPADSQGTPAAFDWSASLGSDYEQFKPTIEGDKIADPKAALSTIATLKQQAASSVQLPGKDAKPEEWAAVWQRLGRPDSPDKYDLSGFTPPEGLPWSADVQKAMVAEMHAEGLTSAQVTGNLNRYAKVYAAQATARDAAAAQASETATAALRAEWKDGYDANIDLAKKGLAATFGADGKTDALKLRLEDGRFLMDVPEIVRLMRDAGAKAAEPGSLPGLGKKTTPTQSSDLAARMWPSKQ